MSESKQEDMLLIGGYCREQHVTLRKRVFDVLFRFYHLDLPFLVSMLNLKNVKASDINKTRLLYQSQCKGLNHSAKQRSLWQCLAYSQQNRLPLLTLCNDRFCRDRLDYYYQHQKTLSLQDWLNKYKVLSAITPPGLESQGTQNIIRSAMTTFFHRYISLLQLPVVQKYHDSLDAFADFIIETTEFIHSLSIDKAVSAPFQIELMIIPRKVVETSAESSEDDDDDDFDSDDDDDDSDDDSDDDKDSPRHSLPKIKERLIGNKVKYEYIKLNKDKCPRRALGNMFNALKGSIHRQRLCIVVDRRDIDTEIFMYLPDILANIPRNHVNEWYFESSNQCIVPGNTERDIIRSRTNANGEMFLLSFHCEEMDQLRCYLYTRSQMARFLPKDIYKLLPQLFVVESGSKNEKFVIREKNKKTRNKADRIKLRDVMFDYFSQQTLTKKHRSR